MSTTDDADIAPEFLGVARPAGVSGELCKVGYILAELDEDHRGRLENALTKMQAEDPTRYVVPAERIVSAVQGWGYSVRVTTVRTHRRKVCACAR